MSLLYPLLLLRSRMLASGANVVLIFFVINFFGAVAEACSCEVPKNVENNETDGFIFFFQFLGKLMFRR